LLPVNLDPWHTVAQPNTRLLASIMQPSLTRHACLHVHLAHCPNIQPYSARTGARIESKECRVHDNQGGECQPRRLHLLLLLLLLPRSSRAKKQPRGNRAKKQPPSPERSTHEVIEPRRQLKRCAAASCHTHTRTHTHTHTHTHTSSSF
jgi:hypothetical protein